MKNFEAVKEFFLSKEIRLKSFNESSFQGGKMKRRATRASRKFKIIKMKGVQSII